MAMLGRKRRRRRTPVYWPDYLVPLDEITGMTNHRNPSALYSVAERRIQGPWWVRFGRWLRGEPQPTLMTERD